MSVRIVEVFGIPASGKTTWADWLAASRPRTLATREQAVARGLSRGRIGWMRWGLSRWTRDFAWGIDGREWLERGTAAYPDLLAAVLDYVAKSRMEDREARVALRGVYQCLREYALIQDVDPREWILMDEGFAHRGLTICGLSLRPDDPAAWLETYVRRLPLPHAALHVDAGIDECLAAIGRRSQAPRGWWSEWSASDHRRVLERASRCASLIAARLAERGVKVVRIRRRDASVEDVLRELCGGMESDE